MKKYFIDTSIWIDYFNDFDKNLNDRIDELIDDNAIFINGIVEIELLHGANDEKDYNDLKSYLNGLNYLEIDKNLFEKISYNSFNLKKKGIQVPISDLIIASQCIDQDLILIDKDKNYNIIKAELNLKRMFE